MEHLSLKSHISYRAQSEIKIFFFSAKGQWQQTSALEECEIPQMPVLTCRCRPVLCSRLLWRLSVTVSGCECPLTGASGSAFCISSRRPRQRRCAVLLIPALTSSLCAPPLALCPRAAALSTDITDSPFSSFLPVLPRSLVCLSPVWPEAGARLLPFPSDVVLLCWMDGL